MNKILKKMAFLILVFALLFTLLSVATADAVFAFENVSYDLQIKKSITLKPILQGAEVPAKAAYVWETSDKAVCTVSKGKVTAKGAGTATITCSLQSQGETLYTTSCEVNVIVPVKSIKLKEEAIYFKYGINTSYQLNYEISPADATDKDLIFEVVSDDPKHDFEKYFSISPTGLITVKNAHATYYRIKVMSASNPKA